MTRPNIQIGDEVREMTEKEHAVYLEAIADSALPQTTNETPATD